MGNEFAKRIKSRQCHVRKIVEKNNGDDITDVDEGVTCPVCGKDLTNVDIESRTTHVDLCLRTGENSNISKDALMPSKKYVTKKVSKRKKLGVHQSVPELLLSSVQKSKEIAACRFTRFYLACDTESNMIDDEVDTLLAKSVEKKKGTCPALYWNHSTSDITFEDKDIFEISKTDQELSNSKPKGDKSSISKTKSENDIHKSKDVNLQHKKINFDYSEISYKTKDTEPSLYHMDDNDNESFFSRDQLLSCVNKNNGFTIKNIYNDSRFSDMHLRSNENQLFFLHKVILFVRCGNLVKYYEKNFENKIMNTDLSTAQLDCFVRFAYYGVLPVDSADIIFIKDFAIKYKIASLLIAMSKSPNIYQPEMGETIEDSLNYVDSIVLPLGFCNNQPENLENSIDETLHSKKHIENKQCNSEIVHYHEKCLNKDNVIADHNSCPLKSDISYDQIQIKSAMQARNNIIGTDGSLVADDLVILNNSSSNINEFNFPGHSTEMDLADFDTSFKAHFNSQKNSHSTSSPKLPIRHLNYISQKVSSKKTELSPTIFKKNLVENQVTENNKDCDVYSLSNDSSSDFVKPLKKFQKENSPENLDKRSFSSVLEVDILHKDYSNNSKNDINTSTYSYENNNDLIVHNNNNLENLEMISENYDFDPNEYYDDNMNYINESAISKNSSYSSVNIHTAKCSNYAISDNDLNRCKDDDYCNNNDSLDITHYSIMETPVLKKKISHYGVKDIAKKKIVSLLKEISKYTKTYKSQTE